jgi:plastocyanin
MRQMLKRDIALTVVTIVLGLGLMSCTQTSASDSVTTNNRTSEPTAQPAATTEADMNMPKMNISPKPAPRSMAAPATAANEVSIENFSFAPATLTVKSGTKVTWINRDDVPHTVDENDKRFKSGPMDTDDQFSYTFSSPGTFSYFCALHPKMVGQIIVK